MVTKSSAMNRWSDEEIEEKLSSGPASRAELKAVDVHTHYVPSVYKSTLAAAGIEKPDGYYLGVPDWTIDDQLSHMERLGIGTAAISLSSPGTVQPGVDAFALARAVNEAGADAARSNPGRLGLIAFIPLSDTDAALEEIAYAFDELNAWGVSVLTHSGPVYLGSEQLAPVFEELGRREAVTLVHPTEPATLVPEVMVGWSRSMYEYFFDTTRAIINLVFSGQLRDNPGVRLVLPHGGAALPMLAQRVERNVMRANLDAGYDKYPGFIDSLRSCWFDLAGSVLPHQIHTVKSLADPTKILWGSDYPYTNSAFGAELAADMRTNEAMTHHERVAILRDNALALFSGRISEEDR